MEPRNYNRSCIWLPCVLVMAANIHRDAWRYKLISKSQKIVGHMSFPVFRNGRRAVLTLPQGVLFVRTNNYARVRNGAGNKWEYLVDSIATTSSANCTMSIQNWVDFPCGVDTYMYRQALWCSGKLAKEIIRWFVRRGSWESATHVVVASRRHVIVNTYLYRSVQRICDSRATSEFTDDHSRAMLHLARYYSRDITR